MTEIARVSDTVPGVCVYHQNTHCTAQELLDVVTAAASAVSMLLGTELNATDICQMNEREAFASSVSP